MQYFCIGINLHLKYKKLIALTLAHFKCVVSTATALRRSPSWVVLRPSRKWCPQLSCAVSFQAAVLRKRNEAAGLVRSWNIAEGVQ